MTYNFVMHLQSFALKNFKKSANVIRKQAQQKI